MGMYANINEEEVKMTGMMAEIIRAILQLDELPPYVILNKEQARVLTTEMVRNLEKPRQLVSDDGTMTSRDLWDLSGNANIAGQLIAWVANSEQRHLEFA